MFPSFSEQLIDGWTPIVSAILFAIPVTLRSSQLKPTISSLSATPPNSIPLSVFENADIVLYAGSEIDSLNSD